MTEDTLAMQRGVKQVAAGNQNIKREVQRLATELAGKYIKDLREENAMLRYKVEKAKKELTDLLEPEKQQMATADVEETKKGKKSDKKPELSSKPMQELETAKQVPEKSSKIASKEPAETKQDVHIGRLDLRIGQIVSVKKHPEANSLYVAEVDLGNGVKKTVLSGLVVHVSLSEMENRTAVFLCNLKPVKMRGIFSEGMILCASVCTSVEILTPPPNSVPGDLVTVEGFERNPDPVLNPKKKIVESVLPDLKTNDKREATYKGLPLVVSGKGVVSAPTLVNANIK